MAIRVFYSWQSDLDSRTNWQFIEQALTTAISRLNKGRTRKDPLWFELDRDTKGIPGSPDIAASILAKIENCDIFVGDLSFVAEIPAPAKKAGKRSPKIKRLPNPNVMLEYGYALRAKGERRLVSIINLHYGSVSDLPFNLSHKRASVTYDLSNSARTKTRNTAQNLVSKQIYEELKTIAESEELYITARLRRRKEPKLN